MAPRYAVAHRGIGVTPTASQTRMDAGMCLFVPTVPTLLQGNARIKWRTGVFTSSILVDQAARLPAIGTTLPALQPSR